MTARTPEDTDRQAPLQLGDPELWQQRLDAINPAAMLVRIDGRMSPVLKRHISAEDIWQETLLRAWRDRKQCAWRGPREFRNWLIGIAENQIRDAVERLGTQKRSSAREISLSPQKHDSDGSAFDPPAKARTPSNEAAHSEQAADMRATLEELPEIYRTVLRLSLFEEWDRGRIAAELKLTLAAVKHRLRLGAVLYRDRLAFLRSTRTSRSQKNLRENH